MMGPGSTVGERYELRSLLGRGGMSTVYLAHDRRLNRDVAVKLLNDALAADPAFVERFKREAQNAAALSHPNIVAVYDWGSDAAAQYIVMEYVAGSTLKEVIERRGARPEREALHVALDVAQALDAAHAHGMVHRDVKPHNILLDTEGAVKVADFGIARAVGDTQLTETGTVLGSAHYAAPEQIERRPVDARSDLYSLGAVLYEMLTGRPPFTGEGPLAVAWQHVHEAPARPTTFVPSIGPATERIVLTALEKDPANRFQSAAGMTRALREALTGEAAGTAPLPALADPTPPATAVAVPVPPLQRATAPTVALEALPRTTRSEDERAERRVTARPLALAALALLLLAPLTVWALTPRSRSQVAAPPATAVPTTPQGVAGAVATAEPSAPAATAPASQPTSSAVRSTATLPPPTSAPPPAATVAGAPVVSTASGAVATVTDFYAAVAQHDFTRAAAQWSPRMQAQYPPAQFIDQRFAQTQSLRLNGARLVEGGTDRAVVAVDLAEVIGNPAETRRWVGTWTLVRSGSAWLLDLPNLAPG